MMRVEGHRSKVSRDFWLVTFDSDMDELGMSSSSRVMIASVSLAWLRDESRSMA